MTATELSDHPFSAENIARESGASDKSEAAWFRWIDKAEKLIGHDLDGDDVGGVGCGYSWDEASDYFDRGVTPHAYVVMVGSRLRYRKPA